MARRLRDNPYNPELFGEDLETAAWTVLGMGASGAVSDKIVGPFIKQIVPWDNEPLGKAVNALATFGAAWLTGKAVGMIDERVGLLFLRGGTYLGVAKVLSIPINGFSLTATFPNILPEYPFGIRQLPQSQPAQLSAGGAALTTQSAPSALDRLGAGSTGL